MEALRVVINIIFTSSLPLGVINPMILSSPISISFKKFVIAKGFMSITTQALLDWLIIWKDNM